MTRVDGNGASAESQRTRVPGIRGRLRLLAFALSAALAACTGYEGAQDPQQGELNGSLGTLQLPLIMVTPGGQTYRLNGTFEIAGPTSLTLRSQDFAEDAPSLVQALPVGRYTITLRPDFELAQRTELGFAPILADLLSPASQRVDVRTGGTTPVAYRFGPRSPATDAGPPAPGNIEVVFSVDEPAGPCTLSEPRQLTLAGVIDVSFDAKRCRLYAATSTGTIFVHDLVRQRTSPFLKLTGSLGGMDISPEHDLLLVADLGVTGIHRVDLRTLSRDIVSFTPAFYEGGTYSVAFANDTTAFTTSTFQGSGWVPLRRVNLSDGSYQEIASVRQNTMLAMSANGAALAYAEANISNGEFGRYALAEQTFVEGAANAFLYDIGVSRDGARYAVPVYSGVLVYALDQQGFSMVGNLGNPAGTALSVAFSPTRDELYVAVSESGGGSVWSYDAQTLEFLAPVVQGLDYGSVSGSGLGAGRLRISRNGQLLMAVTASGVHISPL